MAARTVLACALVVAASVACAAAGGCPFSGGAGAAAGRPVACMRSAVREEQERGARQVAYGSVAPLPDLQEVKAAIKAMLTDSQSFWPADSFGGAPNYGPFLIRQAWHCAGSYRGSDGRGGCDGARQRFEPERSWADNTNLDKAKMLIWPIKQQFPGISWGDLIILAGTTAIEAMGGPVLGFCAGRIDDADGTESLELGPTPQQQLFSNCTHDGACTAPLGATTIGLIYVNPEGPLGSPEPAGSFPQIRDTFGRMGMNDSETVALIGGGHAFGKTHGACPLGPGPAPKDDPANPWPGLCGVNPQNVSTSGFEGHWTQTPSAWSNLYFKNLLGHEWRRTKSPMNHTQWVNASLPGIMMLTSDISLTYDESYRNYSTLFANDMAALETAFAHAWYKLTTRDMGPVARCLGNLVPPAQPFQYPLPPAPPASQLAAFDSVRTDLLAAMRPATVPAGAAINPDVLPSGDLYYGAAFVQLAWHCASTFRKTDYLGGCNGARIRFDPQRSWPVNVALDEVLALLSPIKAKYGAGLSWADLIVLAGQVAIEDAAGVTLTFCPGRTDAPTYDGGSDSLSPAVNFNASDYQVRERIALMGLSNREYVALAGRPRSGSLQLRAGYTGSWGTNPAVLSNEYHLTLLSEVWINGTSIGGHPEFEAEGKGLFMTPADLDIRYSEDFMAIAQEYALSNDLFLTEFTAAWQRIMNVDRFDGPTGNLCPTAKSSPSSTKLTSRPVFVAIISIVATLAVVLVFMQLQKKRSGAESLPLLN
jgi:catalase-peroxidase